MKKTSILLACVVSLFVYNILSSCTIQQRFQIEIQEQEDQPCIGIKKLDFTITLLQEKPEEITRIQQIKGILTRQLFWDRKTGQCMLDGLPLKEIPFGGERQLKVSTFDSTGNYAVSFGTTGPFSLHHDTPFAAPVKLTLRRRSNIGIGTLLITLANPVPESTKQLQVILKAHQGQPEQIRIVNLDTQQEPPTFLILTDIPPASGRPLRISALDSFQLPLAQTQEQGYNIDLKNPQTSVALVSLTFSERFSEGVP